MIDAMTIARRIKSRFARIESSYAAGPQRNGQSAFVDLLWEGRTMQAYVKRIRDHDDPRAAGSEAVEGSRAHIDPLMLAELASKHVSGMARLSKAAEHVAELDVWHKDGRACFIAVANDGARFLVEVREIPAREQILAMLEKAKAAGIEGTEASMAALRS